MNANEDPATQLIGERVQLRGHFRELVVVEAIRPLGAGFELRVRRAAGHLEEIVLSASEFSALVATLTTSSSESTPTNPDHIRLLVESAHIRLAYAYDSQFVVSLSGIRTLPHQIEAVYLKMLPQPRLRFLLADDPGAGKTIMAGLLLKEMKLREAVERVLIIVPAPLTIQWQDELLRFFGETFQIITASNDQQQIVNPWQRETQVITSLDYAKQEDVRERIWQQRWDLVILDEAHKGGWPVRPMPFSNRSSDVWKNSAGSWKNWRRCRVISVRAILNASVAEVEGAVFETLLEKLFGLPRSGISVVDPATRFYVLWRFAYRAAAIDAGEAIVFALPQGVELDGAHSVSHGARALVKKEGNKYRLRDFSELGGDDKLGLPVEGTPPSLIDVLHRVLWLMDNYPAQISEFLGEVRPNLDHLCAVAETLAGAKLAGNGKGGGRSLIAARGEEASALRKLTTNWRTVIEANAKPLM